VASQGASQWRADHFHRWRPAETCGNETLYLVRDVLTGRVLVAENVASSETEMMKQVLSPVVKLGLPVLGVISDAQHSERLAVAQLWPEVVLATWHIRSENRHFEHD
jgi:hypothetical protein